MDMEATEVAEAMEAVEVVMEAMVMARGVWMLSPRISKMSHCSQNWSL